MWPADTFVDFDTGLNTVIKRLREVLRDSAEGSHFIETVPKLGYRFIAPVQVLGDPQRAGIPPKKSARIPGWMKMGGDCGRSAGRLRYDCLLHFQVGAAKSRHGRSRASHRQV